MREFLLALNQVLFVVNILLIGLNLFAGAYFMAAFALMCAVLNFQAVKQIKQAKV